MVNLQESQGRYFVCIPKEKIMRMKYKKGDKFDVNVNEKGNIEIIKIK